MLVSKNPYVVEARVKLHSKNPHFALKTGEIFTQNLHLKSLIFETLPFKSIFGGDKKRLPDE